jgi:hypothetical protein
MAEFNTLRVLHYKPIPGCSDSIYIASQYLWKTEKRDQKEIIVEVKKHKTNLFEKPDLATAIVHRCNIITHDVNETYRFDVKYVSALAEFVKRCRLIQGI